MLLYQADVISQHSGNHYGISSLGFSTNTTDTLTTSYNNFSYLDRHAENVAVSSRCQQPTYFYNKPSTNTQLSSIRLFRAGFKYVEALAQLRGGDS
ncbi:hypothetical protein EAG_15073 [Camponotus floridanus]|uniref:Uncharacterized protein n=1 Tax=Camponotus floridanus TaxID=104421 RepID=E2AC31_CAMFO|nr:hypothetical protein EAG_15073 [Camponotus floridanus]